MELVLSKDFIAQETGLPESGEKWFEKGVMNKTTWKQFLLPLPKNFDSTFGFPIKLLKPKWVPLFQLIFRYLTFDDRFSLAHLYHLRLLMDLKGSKLNLPYFLLNSLEKMATTIQNSIKIQDQSLFHHGLIKILVRHQLSLKGENWDEF